MKDRLVICGCVLCVLSICFLSVTPDTQARRRFDPDQLQHAKENSSVNPDAIREQIEASGANRDSTLSREEQIQSLRNKNGNTGGRSSSMSASAIKIPSGTHIMVKLDTALDSSEMGKGEQFTAKLQGNLVVDGVLMAADGSKVYGKITESERARNTLGTSVIEFTLTGMLIENQMRSIESSHIKVESQGSGRLHTKASIDANETVEFSIGEPGSTIDTTATISDPDKKVNDRANERHEGRRHRRE